MQLVYILQAFNIYCKIALLVAHSCIFLRLYKFSSLTPFLFLQYTLSQKSKLAAQCHPTYYSVNAWRLRFLRSEKKCSQSMRESTHPRRCLPATCKLLRKWRQFSLDVLTAKLRLLGLHGRNKARFSLGSVMREGAGKKLSGDVRNYTFPKYICNKFWYICLCEILTKISDPRNFKSRTIDYMCIHK